jgi:hypothetical protein
MSNKLKNDNIEEDDIAFVFLELMHGYRSNRILIIFCLDTNYRLTRPEKRSN